LQFTVANRRAALNPESADRRAKRKSFSS